MNPTASLLEPSFVDVIAAVEQAADLSEQRRRHWTCSLRQVAKWLDRPAALIPARLGAVQFAVGQLHHARVGVTAKTLANHKANVRAALRWFGKEYQVPPRGLRLSPDWIRFCGKLDRYTRKRVSSLVRYACARGIGPAAVDDKVFGDYWVYRAETTARPTNNSEHRRVVRAWNAGVAMVDDRALQRLTVPPVKVTEPAWEKFPEGLRKDLEAYLDGLAKPHRTLDGKRMQPCRPETIRNCRAEMVAVARMAVRLGVPINSLTGLAALLHPDVVEPVIDAYWEKNGEEPKIGTINLGWKLLRMARETRCLDETALARLDDIRAALEHHRRDGLSEKNLQLVRQVLTEGVWDDVVSLPNVLMRQARSAKDHAPNKAAILAQLAVAIAILTFAPVRLGNLVSIALEQNLHKPGGPNSPYWLCFRVTTSRTGSI